MGRTTCTPQCLPQQRARRPTLGPEALKRLGELPHRFGRGPEATGTNPDQRRVGYTGLSGELPEAATEPREGLHDGESEGFIHYTNMMQGPGRVKSYHVIFA